MRKGSDEHSPGERWPPPGLSLSRPLVAGTRTAIAAGLGVVAGGTSAVFLPWQAAELVGWIVATACYLVSVWATTTGLDAAATARVAGREDLSLPTSELVVLSSAVACLGGVGMALVKAGQVGGGMKAALVILGVASVISAWATVHTIYMLRYARLYYGARHGGIDFNEREAPSYIDFAYVAFTIGTTFQVSDTDLTSKAVRRTVLRHGLLSYLFGAVIVGMTINVVASLLH